MKTQDKDAFYSDLDLSLNIHPLKGDLVPKRNVQAISRSLQTIAQLDRFDIPFEPELFSMIPQMLFEPSTPLTSISLQTKFERLIKKLEPRVKVKEVEVVNNQKGFEITLSYTVRSINTEIRKETFNVERVR